MKAQTKPLSEKEEIEAVFCLSGGELNEGLLQWQIKDTQYECKYWYNGVPDYYEPETRNNGSYFDTRITLIQNYPLATEDLPEGWVLEAEFTTSGECFHPDWAYSEREDPPEYVYLGEGWREIIIRKTYDEAKDFSVRVE